MAINLAEIVGNQKNKKKPIIPNNKSTWLNKSAFQQKNIPKVIGGTLGDAALDLGKGALQVVESPADILGYGAAQVAQWLGNEDWANEIRRQSSKNTVSEMFKPLDQAVENNSILGEKSDSVLNSVGNSYAQFVTGNNLLGKKANLPVTFKGHTLNMPTTSILGGMSSGMSEAYNKGSTNSQAWTKGLTSGVIEGATEGMFGMFGMGGSDLDDILINNATKNIKNRTANTLIRAGLKGLGEGVEEGVSYGLNYVADKAQDSIKNALGFEAPDMANDWSWRELGDNIVSGSVSGVLGGFPSTIQSVRGKTSHVDLNQGIKQFQSKNQLQRNSNQSVQSMLYSQNSSSVPVVNEQGQVAKSERFQYQQTNNVKMNELRKSASKYFNNSIETHNFINTIEKVVSDKNYSVVFDNSIKNKAGQSVNAQISTNKNGKVEIKINPNSNRAGEFLLMHEITHAIETDSMKQLVLDYARKNVDFNHSLEALKQAYGVDDVSSEVVADISGQLFGNQEFINNLSMKQPGIFKRIYNSIISLANKLTGNSKYDLFVKDLKNKWESAYRNSQNHLHNTEYSMIGIKGVNNAIRNDRDNSWLKDNYNKANALVKKGIDNETIRRKTGWFQDKRGDWKFEIADNEAKIISNLEKNKTYKLGEILEHSDLYELYPNLKNTKIKFQDTAPYIKDGKTYVSKGSFNRLTNSITLNNNLIQKGNESILDTLVHEIQHRIQKEEKFAHGFNVTKGVEQYKNSLGEIEARDTTTRRKMDYEDRINEIPEALKKNAIASKNGKWYSYKEENANVQTNQKDIVENRDNDIYPRGYRRNSARQQQGLGNSSFSLVNSDGETIDISHLKENATMERYHYNRKYNKNNITAYRGVSEDTGSNGAFYGLGLYTTLDKSYAKKYGNVYEVDSSLLPDNPLIFKTQNDFQIWEQELARELNVKRNKLYSNEYGVEQYVKKLGYDGLMIGTGKDTDLISFTDVATQYSRDSSLWQEHLEKNYKSTGTKTNMQNIKVPTVEDLQNIRNKNTMPYSKKRLKLKDNFDNVFKSFAEENSNELAKLNKFYEDLSHEINNNKKGTDNIPVPKDPTKESSYDNSVEINKIAKILDSKPDTSSKKESRLKTWIATKILDKGYYIDKIARQYNNRELSAKYDYSLLHNGIANQIIGKGRYDNKGNKIGKSLYEIFEPVENAGLVKEFSDYLYNLHNVDRMILESTFKEENKPVFGESITADKSSKIAYDYEQKYPFFKEWSQNVYDYNNFNLQMLVDHGVISIEDKNYYQQKYPHYVPVVRADDYAKNSMIRTENGKISVGSPIKRAKGGNGDLIPLKDAMATRTMQTVSSSLKNDVGHELLKTVFTDDYKNLFGEKDNIDSIIDTSSSDDIVHAQSPNGDEASLTIFDGGRKLEIPISKEIYEAFTPRKMQTFSFLNKLNNVRRALLTEYNPTFMITNPLKDIQDGHINSKHPTEFIKNLPEAAMQVKNKGKILQLYYAHGGGQDTYFNYDKGTNIEKKLFYKKTGNKLLDTIKIPLKVLDKISSVNESIELTPRLAEFMASIDAGDSLQTAMYNAQEITTNFKRGGDIAKNLDRNGVTFLNAGIQGALKQVRNFQDAKVNGVRGYMNLAVKFSMASLPFILLNNLVWGDDDEYEELSDYIKNNYYIIGKNEDGKFIRIPKGRVTSVIQKMFQNIIDSAQGKEIDFDGFMELLSNQILPNDPTESNLLSPLLQAFGSENGTAWYGGDLVPSRLQNLPNAEQYDESTDSISIFLGKIFNVSPYKINYVLDQYSGAIGDFILPYLTQESESPSDSFGGKLLAPIKDKFTTDSTLKNQNVTELYGLSDKLQKKSNSMNATSEDKLQYKYISNISSEMGKLYAEKRAIQASDLKDSEKYNQARDIQRKIDDLAKKGLSEYSNIIVEPNYGKVGDQEYFLNSNQSWEKIKEDELKDLNKIGMDSKEKNWYFESKIKIAEIRAKKDISSSEKHLSVAEEILNSDLSDDGTAYLYQKYYSSEDALNTIQSFQIPVKDFIKLNSQEFESDYYDNGKAVPNSKRNKLIQYVNSLNLSIPKKAILIKMNYPSYHAYDKEIVRYVNSMSKNAIDKKIMLKSIGFDDYDKDIISYIKSQNITQLEKENKLKKLGFTVRNGKVYYK